MSENSQPKANKWKIQWTTDKIMSTSALFISVISLVALLYQSYLAREENKLIQKQQSASVLPYLHQWYSDNGQEFHLIVGNKGVGPAFITKVEIVLDSMKMFNNSDDLFNELFETAPELDSIPYLTSTLIKGFVMPANEDIKLIEIKESDHIEVFKQVLNSRAIDFAITYEDVYGTQWLLSNENDESASTNIPKLLSN
ncbi:hypothetical protein ACFO5O_02880 [Geojedonia litorea]|uniref:Uncharacterized protein n=1 Tax=Geojedonia litorea TaxID=1268269 RepID=A0ABV9MZ14_9FLAO